ncbi:hypothetical protein LR68_03991 [Anoxybacillus sp. BCO1]|nr:hypothetical protein LR68_03991 [Anoxybacillus sp. BCO1]
MTQSKRQKERQWTVRKQAQNEPHGKVKSFEQLAKRRKNKWKRLSQRSL